MGGRGWAVHWEGRDRFLSVGLRELVAYFRGDAGGVFSDVLFEMCGIFMSVAEKVDGVGGVQGFYTVPLFDLGVRDRRFGGVWAPVAKGAMEAAGVSAYFLENAAEYHASYSAIEYFGGLVREALRRAEVEGEGVKSILDLGSGSGNTVVPLLEIFPESQVVATDISPQLLTILRDYAREDFASERLGLVCADATKNYFVPGGFDLVVGAAILHHVPDVKAALRACYGALKEGGCAIFFEPFEAGNAVLRMAYQRMLTDKRSGTLPAGVRNTLTHMLNTYREMMDIGAEDPRKMELDDKWMFSHSFFFKAATEIGFGYGDIYSVHDAEKPFTSKTRGNLLVTGTPPELMPGWCWEILEEVERLLSGRMKQEMVIEGCVILRK